MLPAEVLALLAGTPVAGAWEPVFPLLTSDSGGAPRICLLSRAEIDAEPGIVRCAVRSRRTSANLRRAGAAVLQVVEGTTSWSVRARVGRTVTDDGGLAAELLVTDVERDSLGIPLQPMSFLAGAALARAERWDDNALLFARLARSAPAAAGEETPR
ncbi:hypothetical protein [Pseudonocardia sp.]|jgi:hypothetical protein|uniref:hypothetical protein n=1 Tax=Pseudonocardia sp. TaxID=60912 RepID=UPI00262910F5|nr:hypothetical protein [Pseudonocardia sp.]MCW2720200.1 hypothetical protein [Pseudonocardia sp.]MDT7614925.1 hypothetical protein [Pseudonocardiales bacterium]